MDRIHITGHVIMANKLCADCDWVRGVGAKPNPESFKGRFGSSLVVITGPIRMALVTTVNNPALTTHEPPSTLPKGAGLN